MSRALFSTVKKKEGYREESGMKGGFLQSLAWYGSETGCDKGYKVVWIVKLDKNAVFLFFFAGCVEMVKMQKKKILKRGSERKERKKK